MGNDRQPGSGIDPKAILDLARGMRHDGFVNTVTGIGDLTRDKTLAGALDGPTFQLNIVSGVEAEAIWRGSDLGQRIVETIPNEMLRTGWEITVQPDEEEDGDETKQDAFPGQPPAVPAPGAIPPALAGMTSPEPKPTGGRVLPDPDDQGITIAEDLAKDLERLKASDAFWHALAYEIAYGGGGILIGAVDGARSDALPLDPESQRIALQMGAHMDAGGYLPGDDPHNLTAPLDEDSISEIRHLTPFKGGPDGEIVAWDYYCDPREARFGEPRIYQLRNIGVPLVPISAPGEANPPAPSRNVSTVHWIHESRLLIFPGTSVSHWARVQNKGWGDGVFTRVKRVLQQFDGAWGGIAIAMQEFSTPIFSMEGFAELCASGSQADQQTLMSRALMLQLMSSVARVRMIDATETYKRENIPMGGVDAVLKQFGYRLAAAVDMPISKLMGQEPGGLGDTGDTTLQGWYDQVEGKRAKKLLPQLKRLSTLLFKAQKGITLGVEPAKWGVSFPSLWQPSESEQATNRKTQAETDQIYILQQVVTPEEIAMSRFGGAKYSTDTTIDFEGRREAAAADAADAAERATKREAAAKDLATQATQVQPLPTGTAGPVGKDAPTAPERSNAPVDPKSAYLKEGMALVEK